MTHKPLMMSLSLKESSLKTNQCGGSCARTWGGKPAAQVKAEEEDVCLKDLTLKWSPDTREWSSWPRLMLMHTWQKRERWTTWPERCRVHVTAQTETVFTGLIYQHQPGRNSCAHFQTPFKKKKKREINKEERWCGAAGSAQHSAVTETINKKTEEKRRGEKRREAPHSKAFRFLGGSRGQYFSCS